MLDRLFVSAGGKDWWLYAPHPSEAIRRAVRGPDALIDRPAVVGHDVLFPCAGGLWASPIGEVLRARGPAIEPQPVWTGELKAWCPDASTATVVDGDGAVFEVEEGRSHGVGKLPWVPRQVARFQHKVVGIGPSGLCSLDPSIRLGGNLRMVGATERALLLLDGSQLLFAWDDAGFRSVPLSDRDRFSWGLFLPRPEPDGVVIGIPEADATPRVFRLRFPHRPEAFAGWEFPTGLWLPTYGQPVSGGTFILASRDVNMPATRLRAYSVLPTDRLGIPRNSDSVEKIIAGPFLAGRVVYVIAAANRAPVVQCYHLFPAE